MAARKRLTAQEREELLLEIRRGVRRGAAAEAIGLERRWTLELIDADAKLRADVEDAEREATEHVEEALYQAAVSGSVQAARLWLEYQGLMTTPRPMGMPAQPAGGGNPFGELDNVTPLARRRRQ